MSGTLTSKCLNRQGFVLERRNDRHYSNAGSAKPAMAFPPRARNALAYHENLPNPRRTQAFK
jgi:hypothetical protein